MGGGWALIHELFEAQSAVGSCAHTQDLFTSLLEAVCFDLALLTYANICWIVRGVPLVMSVAVRDVPLVMSEDKMQITEKVTWSWWVWISPGTPTVPSVFMFVWLHFALLIWRKRSSDASKITSPSCYITKYSIKLSSFTGVNRDYMFRPKVATIK